MLMRPERVGSKLAKRRSVFTPGRKRRAVTRCTSAERAAVLRSVRGSTLWPRRTDPGTWIPVRFRTIMWPWPSMSVLFKRASERASESGRHAVRLRANADRPTGGRATVADDAEIPPPFRSPRVLARPGDGHAPVAGICEARVGHGSAARCGADATHLSKSSPVRVVGRPARRARKSVSVAGRDAPTLEERPIRMAVPPLTTRRWTAHGPRREGRACAGRKWTADAEHRLVVAPVHARRGGEAENADEERSRTRARTRTASECASRASNPSQRTPPNCSVSAVSHAHDAPSLRRRRALLLFRTVLPVLPVLQKKPTQTLVRTAQRTRSLPRVSSSSRRLISPLRLRSSLSLSRSLALSSLSPKRKTPPLARLSPRRPHRLRLRRRRLRWARRAPRWPARRRTWRHGPCRRGGTGEWAWRGS